MEAGGRVTDYDGNSYFMEGDSIVATNAIVYQDLLNGIIQARS